MKPENWQQVKEIFYSALERTPAEREMFLAETCASDADLRRDVEILLESYKTDYLEKPALDKFDPAMTAELPPAEIGEQINHYKILKQIGAGGMGEVFLAEDTRLNRRVAIKFLQTASVFQGQAERRLLREARSAAVLNHPNICTIHEIGTSKDRSFIVMEYVKGETLEKKLERGNLSLDESLRIAVNIADALVEAHAHGVIHRDIKPSNVIINSRGQVKVLDFSLAKKVFAEGDDTTQSLISQAGIIAGTIAYMSPEQARGQAIDARSDIWSLGVVLYEMLTGSLPFAGETKSDIIAAILHSEPVPLKNHFEKMPDEAERITGQALQKNCDERYQTAEDFSADLHRLQRQFDRQAEIEGKSEFDGKEAKPSILEHKTEGIKKIFSNDPIDSAKLTATEINPVTDERKIRSSAEYIVAKIKDRKTIVLAILLVILCGAVGWKIVQWNKSNPSSFTAESRGNLQISSLFSIKRKPKGAISDVSFSPDGKLILFLLSGDGKNDIYIKQPDAGEPIKITDGKWVNQTPIWSPDGQRIAFVSERDGKLGIWTVSYLGGLPVLKTLIELDPLTYQLKKWSNDGKRIYFETNEKLRTIELDSGQISDVRLPQIEIFGSFSISNDEKMITFVVIENQKEKVWTESLETGESKAITNTNKSTWSPVFFPDNQRIAYSSNQNGNYQIYVTDVNGSEPTQITFGDSNANIPTISPDGKRMVYVSESDEANIFSYDLKTSQESQYTSNTKMQLFPSVSPDNEKIVFQDTDYGAKVFASPLKIKILGKENEPNLINPNGGWAKWSPKGDAIAFLRLSGTDVNLWLIDVSNQKERQLSSHGILMGSISNSPYNLMFTPFNWSTDGRKIVFGSIEGELFNIWTINEDGSDLQMITNNQNTDLRYSSPIWSPDGNMIAFTYRTKTEPKKYQNGVSIIRNGQLANLFQNDFKVQILGWSKNGTEIFVTINNLDEISLISIPITSNTKPRTLAKLKGGYFEGTILSPDSQKIAFSARRNGIDNIFVYAINGKEWQLTSNLESTLYYSGLTWSPNGNSLFYSKQSGGMQISMISDSN